LLADPWSCFVISLQCYHLAAEKFVSSTPILFAGNCAAGTMFCSKTCATGAFCDWNLYDDVCSNDEARSMVIREARPGTTIEVYDHAEGWLVV
jgi:hypothetical protein